MKDRIEQWKTSHSPFLSDAATRISSAYAVLTRNETDKAKENVLLFGDTQDAKYVNSLLNPNNEQYRNIQCSAIIAALIAEFQQARTDAVLGDKAAVDLKAELLSDLFEELAKDETDEHIIKDIYANHVKKNLCYNTDREITEFITYENNKYKQIADKSNGQDFDWIYDYGVYIDPLEIKMAEHYFNYPQNKLAAMGERAAGAFLHGFVSQSRNKRDRKRVRLFYQIGQEALAKHVIAALESNGLEAVITAPQSLNCNNQFSIDHQMDNLIYANQKWSKALEETYSKICTTYSKELKDTCGMIGIGQFGALPSNIQRAMNAYEPSGDEIKRSAETEAFKREIDAQYLAPSDISFCKVTFPNKLIKENFDAVFDDVFDFNLVESEPFELIQQTIIDALDKCDFVHIKGKGANKTDITIQLADIQDPKKQTKFLNCGGDLNIPHGELFTTPKLKGTCGLYHISQIYLLGKFYKELMLEFEDGRLISYSCKNIEDESRDKQYIKDNLLFPHDTLEVGEWAIGTNTQAHRVFKKYDLFSRLPILLAEKVGPHLAVGDPCFARGEDAPVYNIYDKKEMVARENETTCMRDKTKDVYTNKHIDITISYEQIDELAGHSNDGKKTVILKDGLFVLPGTQALNEALVDL